MGTLIKKNTYEEKYGIETATRMKKERSDLWMGKSLEERFGADAAKKIKKGISDCNRKKIGDKNPFFGKKHSDKTKKTISESRFGKYDGKDNPNFKGGKFYDNSHGYIYVLDDSLGKTRYKYEHRFIVEGMIGRKLVGKECVHHIDGNKTNNSPVNLLLCSDAGEHRKIHIQLGNSALELVRAGLMRFNKETIKYEFIGTVVA